MKKSIYSELNKIDDEKSLREEWNVSDPDPDGSATAAGYANLHSAEKQFLDKHKFELIDKRGGWSWGSYDYRSNLNGWEVVINKYSDFGKPDVWSLISVDNKKVNQDKSVILDKYGDNIFKTHFGYYGRSFEHLADPFIRPLTDGEKIIFKDGSKFEQDITTTIKKK